MSVFGPIIYAIGAGLVYLLALDILNVKLHLRRWVALAIASAWPALLVIALVFLCVDAIELAWRRRNRRRGA